MADVTKGKRPLSPHMSIWRWQINSISSILTRITGNALLISFLLFVWWLLAASTSPEAFATADGFLTSWFGKLVLIFSALGLWYHFLAGLRHLYWDAGHGLEMRTAEMLGWACVIGSVILTALTVVLVWGA
ncbi:MAG: succinate dehydrogenase, cytochrome b556 subunit [Deltaproteobacteria bacterium]